MPATIKVIYEQIFTLRAQWNHLVYLIANKKHKDYDFIVSVQFKEGYQHNTLPINTVLTISKRAKKY